tara:strand:- start:17019 stop:18011 length:993 start_codon:yes stop_codon:yes gene_type:complete
MIITKTPFRISYLGGGTDFPEWYLRNSGKVISSSIDKFNFVTLRNLQNIFNYKFRIRYYYNERCENVKDIKHPTVRNLINLYKIKNVELINYSDLVAMSGIGSSSAFTVGLLKAILEIKKKRLKPIDLAKKAINVERNLNKDYVGCQDQFACAFGGLNSIRFSKKNIKVTNLSMYKKNANMIDQSTLLLFTKIHRNSAIPTKELITQMKFGKINNHLERLKTLADEGERIIKSNKFDNKIFGEILNESWELKKNCSKKITNNTIDYITNIAKKNGAFASKVIGAGGGGFMIIYAEKKFHKNIKKKLNKFDFIDFNFTNEGVTTIFNSQEL